MTAAKAVEMSVTNNYSQDYNNLDNQLHTSNDTPGFKPFTLEWHSLEMLDLQHTI